MATSVLYGYHPLEPEMWLHLADGRLFPQCFYSGTMEPIVAPWPNMDTTPKRVEQYCASLWRGEEMPLLDFLRKSNVKDGAIHKWVRKRFDKEKRDGESLEEFARLEGCNKHNGPDREVSKKSFFPSIGRHGPDRPRPGPV